MEVAHTVGQNLLFIIVLLSDGHMTEKTFDIIEEVVEENEEDEEKEDEEKEDEENEENEEKDEEEYEEDDDKDEELKGLLTWY